MNNDENKSFDKCMKEIRRLLIEEKQTKQKLEKIQQAKSILEILKGEE